MTNSTTADRQRGAWTTIGAMACLALAASLSASACGTDTPEPDDTECKSAKPDADGWYSGKTANGLYNIRWKTEPDVTPKLLLEFTIEVTSAGDGSPVAGDVELKGFMPQHGHGFEGYTPVPSPVSGQTGSYKVTGVVMGMLGRWDLTVQVKAKAGADEAMFTICL